MAGIAASSPVREDEDVLRSLFLLQQQRKSAESKGKHKEMRIEEISEKKNGRDEPDGERRKVGGKERGERARRGR